MSNDKLKKYYDDIERQLINTVNDHLQKKQWEKGCSFVSQTTINLPQYNLLDTVILRTAVINPLTNTTHLDAILTEQRNIALSVEKNVFATFTKTSLSR